MSALISSPIAKLGITLGALYFAYRYGSPQVKGMALGAAGLILLNQVPVVRDGASVQLIASAA